MLKKMIISIGLYSLMIMGCGEKASHSGASDSLSVSDSPTQQAAPTPVVDKDERQNQSYTYKEGKRLFSHYCAVCHGQSGDGTGRYYGYGLEPKPANFTDSSFFMTLTDDSMYQSIHDGPKSIGKSNLCPPWGNTLHDEEIHFLIDYIKTLSKTDQI
jgi:mono/diheme cytochrome c family protein